MNKVFIYLTVFFLFLCPMFPVSASTWSSLGSFCVDSDCGETSGNIDNPTGCCVAGDSLWVCGDGKFVQYNKSTGAYISSFNYANDEGVCWNGTHLWCVNGDSAYLISTSGSVISTIANLPGGGDCRGIAYDGSFLWVASRNDDALYQCKTDGTLLRTIDVSGHTHNGNNLDGLTWDGSRLIYVSAVSNDFVVVNMSDDSEYDNFDPGYQSSGVGYDASEQVFYNARRAASAMVYDYTYPHDSSAFEPSSVTNETWEITQSGSSADLTINWTKGLNSNYTLIRKGSTSYPSDIYDGDFFYFGTGNGTVDSGLSSASVYTMWSYNSSGNWYGDPVYLNWTASWINVYNESNPSQNLTCWDVEISNQLGTEVYISTCNNNSLIVNLSDLPSGIVTFIFNRTGYKQRTYQLNIASGETIDFDAYLPPLTETTDDGTVTSQLYRIRVIDSYEYPVGDAYVTLKHYINTSDTYETVGNQTTDGYGETDFYLLPNEHYKIFVEKSGFDDAVVDYWTDPDFYGANYPKIVQIEYSTDETPDYDFWDVCIFNATMYNNNSIKVTYIDQLSETTSATFETYELYNDTESLNATNTTTSNSFTFWITNINTSRSHRIELELDHTSLGTANVSILVMPLRSSIRSITNVNTIIGNIMGDWDIYDGGLGYVELFIIFIPFIVIIGLAAKKHHAGGGIVIGSLYGAFVTGVVFSHDIVEVMPFVAAIGIALIAVKGGFAEL